uniref:Uncharacterized protein n=1 Tax=Romanomermis culicivorax TaxID=13658 RepID=A0A915J5J6_ROMCU
MHKNRKKNTAREWNDRTNIKPIPQTFASDRPKVWSHLPQPYMIAKIDNYSAQIHTASTSTKSSSTTNLRNWLPKKPLLSVKQRLAKRFSAENSPPPYKFRFDSSTPDDSSSAFRVWGLGQDCSVRLIDISRPVKHTSKRLRTWYREHSKIFREFLFTWTLRDLHCLVVEFEAAKALSRLKWQADAARQPAPTIVDDLLCALRDGIAADTLVTFQNVWKIPNEVENKILRSDEKPAKYWPLTSKRRDKVNQWIETDEGWLSPRMSSFRFFVFVKV